MIDHFVRAREVAGAIPPKSAGCLTIAVIRLTIVMKSASAFWPPRSELVAENLLQDGGGDAVAARPEAAPPRWRLSMRPRRGGAGSGKIPLVFGITMGYNYSRLATKGVR